MITQVKYQSAEFRDKNLDLMKGDIVAVMKSSQLTFLRELVGGDPVATYRWGILRAFFRAYHAFVDAGRRYRGNCYNINYLLFTSIYAGWLDIFFMYWIFNSVIHC